MLQDIRCGKCSKLLGRIGFFSEIQIKCARCGTLNHMKAESLHASPVSDIESTKNFNAGNI